MPGHPIPDQRRRRASDQRGQVLPLCLLVVALAAAVALCLVHLGAVVARRSRAQAAADAAALAGATEGERAARRLAAANGARLVQFHQLGEDVLVVVVRQGIRASARARWVVGRPAMRASPSWPQRCRPRPVIP